MMPDFSDPEAIINSMIAEYYKLGQTIFSHTERLRPLELEMPHYDPKIPFLHEKIESL